MTIGLYEVKLNNTYTYYQNADVTTPTAGQTLLADTTAGGFTRGQSYNYSGTGWDRIEVKEDLQTDIYGNISEILGYIRTRVKDTFYMPNYNYIRSQDTSVCSERIIINNPDYTRYGDKWNLKYRDILKNLYIAEELTFTTSTFETIKDVFKVGDLIEIKEATRNKGIIATITDITELDGVYTITVDNTLIAEETYSLIFGLDIPLSVQNAIAKLIWYKTYIQEKPSNVISERQGDYAVNLMQSDQKQFANSVYPDSLIQPFQQYNYDNIG